MEQDSPRDKHCRLTLFSAIMQFVTQMQFEIYYLAGKIIIFDGFKRHNPPPPSPQKIEKNARSKSQTLNYRLQGLDIKRFIK